jgi:uncharacterized protein YjiS (DUF1127 family)
MLEFERPALSPLRRELLRPARRQRSLVVNALMRSAAPQFAEWFCALAAQLTGAFAAKLRYQHTIRDLEQLNDRMLADIGVGWSEIRYRVSHAAARRRHLPPSLADRSPVNRKAA